MVIWGAKVSYGGSGGAYRKGSAPLGGTFSLSFDDKTTLQLPYSASGLEVSDELESIGKVTASRHTHVASKIPGVCAVVKRDASSLSLVTDAADDTAAPCVRFIAQPPYSSFIAKGG
jgi:hypothetical protein